MARQEEIRVDSRVCERVFAESNGGVMNVSMATFGHENLFLSLATKHQVFGTVLTCTLFAVYFLLHSQSYIGLPTYAHNRIKSYT
jgi:hypothetical protein